MPHVSCPKGHPLQVSDRHIGQVIKCPSCQSSFVAEAAENVIEVGEIVRSEKEGTTRSPSGGKNLREGVSIVSLANSFVGKPLQSRQGAKQIAARAVLGPGGERERRLEATARGRSESLEQVLIGAIVLEDLDLMVDCVTRKLHPRDPRFTISEIE